MRSLITPRLLTATVVVSAICAILATGGPAAWMPAHYIAKPLATIAIIVLAATATNPLSARYQRYMVGGLVLSLLGDVLLMLPTDLFAFGLGAFLLAHLCYISAFLGESRFLSKPVALVGYA